MSHRTLASPIAGNGTTSGSLGSPGCGLQPIVGACTTARVGIYQPSGSDLPAELAAYAGAVAARYPWVNAWTPVKQPLTTARFSGLYGHWFPHERNVGAFCRMVVNQCLGVLQAMQAIRAAIPAQNWCKPRTSTVFATPR